MSLGDYAVGTQALDLSSFEFPPGIYQVFVKAVGKPSIVNRMSAPANYTAGPPGPPTQRPPTVNITSPYDGQDAGPYTDLNANASSVNGAITQYQVFVDGNWVMTVAGAPSFQAWVGTTMGDHTITVEAEDALQQWGSAQVWIDRTY
jgi:hypothetical protein